ncbi:MAG: hypothetical protein FJZ49_01480 [Candidatus Verstraetearchaeota archaeon]|nr:hypothetical protein [Candidatus Verstraetearchaeota archaeon]
MQLGTFGAILKYAIEIEDAASLYYDELVKKASEGSKTSISELSNASKKNKQALERTRRMEMQEMILEAISGIDTVNYDAKFDVPADFKAGLMNAVEIEKKATAFYSDSSKKLGFLPNVERILEKIGKEREARIEKIRVFL